MNPQEELEGKIERLASIVAELQVQLTELREEFDKHIVEESATDYPTQD